MCALRPEGPFDEARGRGPCLGGFGRRPTLTREGEVALDRRIEEGEAAVLRALAGSPVVGFETLRRMDSRRLEAVDEYVRSGLCRAVVSLRRYFGEPDDGRGCTRASSLGELRHERRRCARRRRGDNDRVVH